MSKKIMLPGLAFAAIFLGTSVWAADQAKAKDSDQQQTRTPPRQTTGSQLMTPAERQEHRAKMRSAATNEQRDKVRAEQHKKMKARAEEQGKTIPENPPAGGMGGRMNRGGGMGGPGR